MHENESHTPSVATGFAAAIGAFFLWGVLTIYWKSLQGVAALEVVAHRVVWSVPFLLLIIRMRGRWPAFVAAFRDMRWVGLYALSGALLGVNWLTFVFAVTSGQIVEASLGYFLNPLVTVLLGCVVLRERLRGAQWVALGLAGAGVVLQIVRVGRLPWIALVLAVSFALYGLLRKRGPLGPLSGLAVETVLLAPLAAGYVVWRQVEGLGALGEVAMGQHLLLFGAGVVTAIPLLLFATAARALPLSTVGFVQYLAPSLQLLVGVALYREPFASDRLASFACIWAGLAVFTFDAIRQVRRRGAGGVPVDPPLEG